MRKFSFKRISPIIIILVILYATIEMKAQTAQWAHSIGGLNTDYATALTHDHDGNIYVTGTAKQLAYFNDTCATCVVTGDVLGNGSSYLVKYDSNGKHQWSKLIYKGQTSFNGPKEIHLDGNLIHIVIAYFDSIILDPASAAVNINTPNRSAIIHLQFDVNGNYISHREVLPKSYVYGNDNWYLSDVDFDANGNLFVAGGFGDTLSVNSTVYGIPQQWAECIFKVEPNGQVTWFYDNMSVLSLSVDHQNHLYAGVNFTDSISLILNNVPTTYHTLDVPNSNLSDGLLLRINPTGGIVSAKHISGKDNQYIQEVRCKNDRVTIAGVFEDSLIYAPNGIKLGCYGQNRDVFILQFANDTLRWIKQLYSSAVVFPTDITYSPDESVYITGIFSDSLIADYKNSQIVKLSPPAPSIFTVKYSDSPYGFLEQFHTLVSPNFQLGPHLDFVNDESFYMIASYETQTPIQFTGNQSYVTSRGGVDGLIAKYHVTSPTHIVNYASRISATIYPNPSDGRVNIQADKKIKDLSVYDYTGKKLYATSPNKVSCMLELKELPSGIYTLNLNFGNISKAYKILIQ